MKYLLLMLFSSVALWSQKQDPCEFSTNVSDSIGTYKATKDYIMHERNFGNTSSYVMFALEITNDIPSLNAKFITSSKDFIKANCFDKNSKMFLQLENGKIITLIHTDSEDCGTAVNNGDKGISTRVQVGNFLFMKGSLEELKKSPVSLLRVRYSTETMDFLIRSEIVSELNSETYQPANYFINVLPCVDN